MPVNAYISKKMFIFLFVKEGKSILVPQKWVIEQFFTVCCCFPGLIVQQLFCVSTRWFFWIVIGLHSIIFCHKETTVCVFTLWTPADMFWLKVSPVWNWKKGSFMHAQPDTIRALLWNVVSNPLTDWSNEKIPKIDLNASVLFWHSATKN